MLCGHYHWAAVLEKGNDRALIPHAYPIVIGSVHNEKDLMGAGITLNKKEMKVVFTDVERKVAETHAIALR
jgi:hypothetical protein